MTHFIFVSGALTVYQLDKIYKTGHLLKIQLFTCNYGPLSKFYKGQVTCPTKMDNKLAELNPKQILFRSISVHRKLVYEQRVTHTKGS